MMKKNLFLRMAALLGAAVLCLGLVVACSDSDADGQTIVVPDPEPEPDPESGLELNCVTYTAYSFNSDTRVANYLLTVASDWPDAYDNPAADGDVMMVLDLYAEMADDLGNIRLPAGTYEMGEAWTKQSWSPSSTIFQIRVDGEVETLPMAAGTVVVADDGSDYSIAIEMTSVSGLNISATFAGKLEFRSSGSVNYATFTTAQEIEFEHYSTHSTRYWGSWFYPHADDFALTFYTGEVEGEDRQAEGYMLKLACYMHKVSDKSPDPMPIEEGVYTINPRQTNFMTAIPMSVTMGEIMSIDILGDNIPMYTYLTYIDGTTGMRTIGILTGGTMTVKKNSENVWRFDFDFLTEQGVSVKGSYEGDFAMKNYNDDHTGQYPVPERPISDIPGDVELSFGEYADCSAFYMGSCIYSGYDNWMIYILDADGPGDDAEPVGDYLTFEVLVPAGTFGPLPDATYTVGWGPGSYVAFPGFITHTNNIYYAWYADMSSLDSEGVPTVMGPIESGTFTAERTGDGPAGYDAVYRFTFDLKDDGGHGIAGEWTGPVSLVNYTEDAAGMAVRSARKPSLRR